MTWIIFSILAAIAWAIVNILDKFILTKWIKNPIILIMIFSIIGLIVSIFIYLIHGLQEISFFNMILVIITSVFSILTTLFYFKAAYIEEISRIVPLLRLSPFFVLVFAYFFLGETFDLMKYAGVAFLVIGSLLISIKLSFGKPFWFMMVAVISSSVSTIITKYLLNYADFWTIFAYLRIGIFITLIPVFYWNFSDLILIIKKQRGKITWLLSLNELLYLLGVLFMTIAISLNSATLATSLSSIHPFFVLLFAVFLSLFYSNILKEKIGKTDMLLKLISIILILIGVILIT